MSIWLLGSMMALAFLAITALWWFRQPGAVVPLQEAMAPRSSAPVAAPQRQATAAPGVTPGFDWHTEERLDPVRRGHLLAGIHDIPRPPAP